MKGRHPSHGPRYRRAAVINWIKTGIVAFALTLAVMYFVDNKDQVQVVLHDARLDLLLVSVACACLANVFLYVGWCVLTVGGGDFRSNAIREFWARSISELGKYVPGRVASYLILYQYRDKNAEREHGLITSAFWELFGVIITGGVLAAMAYTPVPVYVSAVLAASVLLLISLFHPHMLSVIGFGLQKLQMERTATTIRRAELPKSRITGVFILYITSWISLGVNTIFVVYALIDDSVIKIIDCIGAVSIAGMGGMAVFLAPAGIGAKDIVLAQLLQHEATVVEIATVVACVRFTTIIADILLAGAGYLGLSGLSKAHHIDRT